MIKPYICYKKNCWTTDFSVLAEAASKEEEHGKEDLDKRSIPHTHKEDSNKEDKEKEEIKKSIQSISTSYDENLKVYQNTDKKSEVYNLNETNFKNKGIPAGKKSEPIEFSHDHSMLEYEEFMIEKVPIGGVKIANFYSTTIGSFKKKGLVPIYTVNRFDRY